MYVEIDTYLYKIVSILISMTLAFRKHFGCDYSVSGPKCFCGSHTYIKGMGLTALIFSCLVCLNTLNSLNVK